MKKEFDIVYNPTEKELKEALLLDRQSFPKDRWASYFVCRFWLKKNPDCFIVLKLKDRVIGYVCFLSLTKSAFQKYFNGEIHEYALRSKDIERFVPGQEHNCLFCCVNIDKDFRNGKAALYMMRGYKNLLLSLQKRNVKIKNILADCITDNGQKLARIMGFEQIRKTPDGILFIKRD